MIPLQYDNEGLSKLCRQYAVKRLAVFGSVLHGDNNPGSDLDLLIEFQADAHPGWDLFPLQEELSYLFGQTVDLNTPGFISRYFRSQVLQEAQTIYAG
jgi:hypothetical protein